MTSPFTYLSSAFGTGVFFLYTRTKSTWNCRYISRRFLLLFLFVRRFDVQWRFISLRSDVWARYFKSLSWMSLLCTIYIYSTAAREFVYAWLKKYWKKEFCDLSSTNIIYIYICTYILIEVDVTTDAPFLAVAILY